MKNARSTKNKVIVNGQIAENVIIRMFVMNGVIKMGMSIDEAIEILHGRDKCMEYVTDNDSEAFDMAIDIMSKYQQLQAEYEARLKADMVAMLTEIHIEMLLDLKHEIQETEKTVDSNTAAYWWKEGIRDSVNVIQSRINILKAVQEKGNKYGKI